MSDDLTRLTDEEREALGLLVGNGYLTRVGTRVLFDKIESILAARTAALLDRAERAEREVGELEDIHAELIEACSEKYEALRERARVAASELGAKNGRLAAELAALRAAVTGLADEWLQEGAASARQQFGEETTDAQAERLRLRAIQFKAQSDRVRALLTDEGDNG